MIFAACRCRRGEKTPERLDYRFAFIAGLLGSGHCVGMCGSLVSAFFVRLGDAGEGWRPVVAYHGTRILVMNGLLRAFGLGTLPSMVFVSVVFGRLGARLRGILLKAAALVVIAMGVATLLQGARFFQVMLLLPNW